MLIRTLWCIFAVVCVETNTYAGPGQVELFVNYSDVDEAIICHEYPHTNYPPITENAVVLSEEVINTRQIFRSVDPILELIAVGDVWVEMQPYIIDAEPSDMLCGAASPLTYGAMYNVAQLARDTCVNNRRPCDISRRLSTATYAHRAPTDKVVTGEAVTVAWDPVDDVRVAHYEVCWGYNNEPGQYTDVAHVTIPDTSATIETPLTGEYRIAVRACSEGASLCSDFSNELGITVVLP